MDFYNASLKKVANIYAGLPFRLSPEGDRARCGLMRL